MPKYYHLLRMMVLKGNFTTMKSATENCIVPTVGSTYVFFAISIGI